MNYLGTRFPNFINDHEITFLRRLLTSYFLRLLTFTSYSSRYSLLTLPIYLFWSVLSYPILSYPMLSYPVLFCFHYHTIQQRRVRGLIVGWLPALGDDCALWHIQHSDGDVEDLELHEVQYVLQPHFPSTRAVLSSTYVRCMISLHFD